MEKEKRSFRDRLSLRPSSRKDRREQSRSKNPQATGEVIALLSDSQALPAAQALAVPKADNAGKSTGAAAPQVPPKADPPPSTIQPADEPVVPDPAFQDDGKAPDVILEATRHAQAANSPNAAGSRSLWDVAYARLREDNPMLVNKYGIIVTRELNEPFTAAAVANTAAPAQAGSSLNDAASQVVLNQKQLQTVIERGQVRMQEKAVKYRIAGHEFDLNEQVAQTTELILWGKTLIDGAVKASPEASVAWSVISLILPLVTRSSETAQVHRDGFCHVTARMEFYTGLEPILFSPGHDPAIKASENSIVELYQNILDFLFRSVLRFFRGRIPNWARDVAQHDDWSGMLKNIQKLENSLRDDLGNIADAVTVEKLAKLSQSSMESVGLMRKLLTATEDQLLAINKLVDIAKESLDLQKYNLTIDEGAIYGSAEDQYRPFCLDGTNKSILKKITEWANDDDGETILWLHGPAGTGKSTISRTIARNLSKVGQLAASYFFRNPTRINSERVLPTIAAELVASVPGLERLVCNGLDELGRLGKAKMETRSLDEQFQLLILRPLKELSKHWSATWTRIIVIDAIDECRDTEGIAATCQLLQQLHEFHNMGLRVLLSSRFDHPINEVLVDSTKNPAVRSLSLIDSNESSKDGGSSLRDETRQDVIKLIQTRFATIKRKKLRSTPDPWPTNSDMERLYTLATTPSPLFIYADTLCRFIDDPTENPKSQLKAWLELSPDDSQLRQTYAPILDRLLFKHKEGQRTPISSTARSNLEMILGAVTSLTTPLSHPSLAKLLGMDEDDLGNWLDKLHAVLNIPADSNAPVTVLHKSFPDFLFGQDDTGVECLRLNIKNVHKMLASRCMIRMQKPNEGLKRNICDLEDYAIHVNLIEGSRIARAFPPDLKYACVYWVDHLLHCMQRIQFERIFQNDFERMKALEAVLYTDVTSFLERHFLHWLEALGLLRCMSRATAEVAKLVATSKILSPQSRPIRLVEDMNRFMVANGEVIRESPLQTYLSSLIFSPTSSPTRQIFKTEEPDWITTKPAVKATWSSCLQTLDAHIGPVLALAFSHSGQELASFSVDHTVKIWDATSGACLRSLNGSYSGISLPRPCVVFSKDDCQVLLIFRGSIYIWNVGTGACILTTHIETASSSNPVSCYGRSFASSRKSTSFPFGYVVAISDTLSGDMLHRFEAQRFPEHLTLSNDGTHVAAHRYDGPIYVWNTVSKDPMCTIDCSQYGLVGTLVFSGDNRLLSLVVKNTDGLVLIWDLESHTLFRTFRDDVRFFSACFSQSNEHLALGDVTGNITIWNIIGDICIAQLKGHRNTVTSLAFSTDDNTLASCSYDGLVRIWDVSGIINQQYTNLVVKDTIIALALSLDGKLVACASRDAVTLWSVQDGTCIQKLKTNKSLTSRSMSFSHDSRLVALTMESTAHTMHVQICDLGKNVIHQLLEEDLAGDKESTQAYDPTVPATFSSDGRIFTYKGDGIVKIWNPRTREHLESLDVGHTVCSFAISHDCELMVSGGFDGVVKIRRTCGQYKLQIFQHGAGKGKYRKDYIRCVAFSQDDTLVASSSDSECKVWNVKGGLCLHTIAFSRRISFGKIDLTFDATASYLFTNYGTYSLTGTELSQRQGYGISDDDKWITWNDRNLLWLPYEYRPKFGESIFKPGLIAIGTDSGQMLIFGVSKDASPFDGKVL